MSADRPPTSERVYSKLTLITGASQDGEWLIQTIGTNVVGAVCAVDRTTGIVVPFTAILMLTPYTP